MKVADVIWAILRGILRVLADEFPLGGRRKPADEKKEAPWWSDARDGAAASEPQSTRPANGQEKVATPAWWGAPTTPPPPPTIKVETDAGTFIASTTFSGGQMLGVRPVERVREEGESRRRRRTSSPVVKDEVSPHPSEPEIPVEETAAADEAPRQLAPTEVEGAGTNLIDATDVPRVARARRVRGRFGANDTPGSNTLATTLATRLALASATASLPAREATP